MTRELKTSNIPGTPSVLIIDALATNVPAKLTLTTVLTSARESDVGKLKH